MNSTIQVKSIANGFLVSSFSEDYRETLYYCQSPDEVADKVEELLLDDVDTDL